MRRLYDLGLSLSTIAWVGGSAIAAWIVNSPAVQAQAAYGSYVGIGFSAGLTEGTRNGAVDSEERKSAAVFATRYKILEVPISLRTQTLLFNPTTAFVPTISYDFPLSWQSDAYIGVGYSFSKGESPSPVGNQNSFAIQPGIDFAIPDTNLVLFGNAIIAFDAYREAGGAAVSLQGGVGLNFR
ncbi:hypothetical protein OOK60_02845 [Trichothermofontia sichuanensis B231]|uniref:hypothetical protein n=1 Tax=Trichothermofontia sichuanensis TaxID=3045816 RepID=UPI0022469066|nr:hypothetical protein [Trichothermofontia sichuanensis]UZQ55034.1 hypothetical protein OOK60_02845 [Trichothermofontia sichuanensis B231]